MPPSVLGTQHMLCGAVEKRRPGACFLVQIIFPDFFSYFNKHPKFLIVGEVLT